MLRTTAMTAVVAAMTAACSPGSQTRLLQPSRSTAARSVAVVVEERGPATSVERLLLANRVAAHLPGWRGRVIVGESPSAEAILRISVTRVERLELSEQLTGSAVLARALVEADVALEDALTGQILTRAAVSGVSG